MIGEATAICMHDDFVLENVDRFTIQHNSCAAPMKLCAGEYWDLYLVLCDLSTGRLRWPFEDDND